jgi:hypothetical protein
MDCCTVSGLNEWLKYLDPDHSIRKAVEQDSFARRLNYTKGISILKEDGSRAIHDSLMVVK